MDRLIHDLFLLSFVVCICAKVEWKIEQKISAYGEDLRLLCIADNYSIDGMKIKIWEGGPKQKMLTLNGAPDQEDVMKYKMSMRKDGFDLVINNVSKADLNVTYECTYGFKKSGKVILKIEDAFEVRQIVHVKPSKRESKGTNIEIICVIIVSSLVIPAVSTLILLHKYGKLKELKYICSSNDNSVDRNDGVQNSKDLTKPKKDGCEELSEVLYNRCGHKNFNHIELTDVEKFKDDGQDTDNYSKETDGLLQDSIHNLNITGEKNYVLGVDAKPFNTGRNHDKDNLQLGRSSDSDSSLIGAGNNNISDISTCGPRSITDESCQASWSGEKSGNTKNGSEETLPKAMHRQPEILSDSPKDVESVATNADTNPAALKIKTVVSESTSVQSVDNVSHNFEKCVGIGQLPHSPDNVIRYERSDVAGLSSVNSELNDTELKKEVSSENTIVKASEQKSTFSSTPSLHVDSMFSGGNTNSSGPSYIYLLRWEMSGDDRPRRGRIEYWENPHYGHKSNVLTDLETGKVLLKSPKKYMNDNVVYLVPDKQNNGIEPFMQIKLEQLEDEIDIQSLLKSGATIYDLDTFEIIDQQRPQLNPAHSGQLLSEQPHHMPLPHEQNQSDNGIDNNTENNEVQNDDQFNNLSLGSFENDN